MDVTVKTGRSSITNGSRLSIYLFTEEDGDEIRDVVDFEKIRLFKYSLPQV